MMFLSLFGIQIQRKTTIFSRLYSKLQDSFLYSPSHKPIIIQMVKWILPLDSSSSSIDSKGTNDVPDFEREVTIFGFYPAIVKCLMHLSILHCVISILLKSLCHFVKYNRYMNMKIH